MTVSKPYFAAPDLSNVMSLEGQLGGDTGYSKFMTAYLRYKINEQHRAEQALAKAQKDAQRAAEKAKKDAQKQADAAAKNAVAQNPNSQGFWQKVGQMAGDGLHRTLDVLSRGDYAASNFAQAMAGRDLKRDKAHTPFWQDWAGELGDIPYALKQGWRGLEGKDKTTMGQVLAWRGQNDPKAAGFMKGQGGFKTHDFGTHHVPLLGNIHFQATERGLLGFAGDVLADPTTYIGVGLITKPLKGAKAAMAIEKSSTAAKIKDFANQAEKVKPVIPGHDIPLSAHDIYQALGGPTLTKSGKFARGGIHLDRKGLSKASQAADTRNFLNNYERIKKAIHNVNPDVATHVEKVNALSDALDQLRHDYVNARETAGHAAYTAHIDAQVAKGEPPVGTAIDTAEKLKFRVTDALETDRVAKAFEKDYWFKKKGDVNGNMPFEKAIGDAFHLDPRISPEFRASVLSHVESIAKDHPRFKALSDKLFSTLYPAVRKATADYKVAEKAGDVNGMKQASSDLAKLRGTARSGPGPVKVAQNEMNQIKANIFINLVGAHVGDARFAGDAGKELSGLLEKKAMLERDLGHASDNLQELPDVGKSQVHYANSDRTLVRDKQGNLVSDGVIGSKTDAGKVSKAHERTVQGPQTMGESLDPKTADLNPDTITAKSQELDAVNKRIHEIAASDAIRSTHTTVTPHDAPTDVSSLLQGLKDQSLSPEATRFAEEVSREVDQRSSVILARKIRTERRAMREALLNKNQPERIAKMFGGKNKATPKIEVNGVEVLKNAEGKKFIAEHGLIDKADHAKYRAERDASRNARVDKGTVEVKLDGSESTVASAAAKAEVTTTGHAVQEPGYNAFDRLFKEQHGTTLEGAIKQRKAVEAGAKSDNRLVPHERDIKIPADAMTQMTRDANTEAIHAVNNQLKAGQFKTVADHRVDLTDARTLVDGIAEQSDIVEVHRYMIARTDEEYAKKLDELKAEQKVAANREVVKAKAEEIKKQWEYEKDVLNKALEEAKKARGAMAARMDEQLTLDMLHENLQMGSNYIRFSFAGVKIADIPDFMRLSQASAAMGNLPILRTASKLWADGFHPASKLEPEMNLARLRMQSRTPEIIKHHVDEIRQTFSKFTRGERNAAFRGISKGVPVGGAAHDALQKYLSEFTPYLTGKMQVMGEPLTIREINKFLGHEFQFVHPKGGNVDALVLDTPQKMIKAMRRLKSDTDPMKVVWHMRIAAEQALAEKAMYGNIKHIFGVKRVIRHATEKNLPMTDAERLIEKLHDSHDWRTVRDIGEDYYFPPEMASQVEKLVKMMKPQNTHLITKQLDKILHIWKSSVTVYNPGYYVRNGVGETMMSMMDGLVHPGPYQRAMRVLNHSMPDQVEKAVRSLEPWKKYASESALGSRKVVKTKFGKELTAEEIWVLYNQSGLKTGFVSSEFDHYFPQANGLRHTPVGQFASKINDSMRQVGEKYEDYFRLAHFIHRLETSNIKDVQRAADEAAKSVRKFHFDYTDFTPYEKTVMMRLFPFYKWTRKALPLMASMVFTRPGMVTLYPKAMQNISYATGGTDPLTDKNGLLPNYDKATPQWMQSLMAYPVGRDQENNMTYMHVATPTFDIYRMMQNPANAALGMLNPLGKVPLEELMGRTLDTPANSKQMFTGSDRVDHLMRTSPQTSFLDNVLKNSGPNKPQHPGPGAQPLPKDSAITEPGAVMDERLATFLTGLGFYENNKRQQKGETLRKNIKKSNDAKKAVEAAIQNSAF